MNISFFLNPLDSHRSDIAKDIFIIPTEKIHTHTDTQNLVLKKCLRCKNQCKSIPDNF